VILSIRLMNPCDKALHGGFIVARQMILKVNVSLIFNS